MMQQKSRMVNVRKQTIDAARQYLEQYAQLLACSLSPNDKSKSGDIQQTISLLERKSPNLPVKTILVNDAVVKINGRRPMGETILRAAGFEPGAHDLYWERKDGTRKKLVLNGQQPLVDGKRFVAVEKLRA